MLLTYKNVRQYNNIYYLLSIKYESSQFGSTSCFVRTKVTSELVLKLSAQKQACNRSNVMEVLRYVM